MLEIKGNHGKGHRIQWLLCVLITMILGHDKASAQGEKGTKDYQLLVGTYTRSGKGKGIYSYRFNVHTGELSFEYMVEGVNPSYLEISPLGDRIYAVSEVGHGKGSVNSFSFDGSNGHMEFINSISSGGDGPCYIAVDPSSQFVYVANYSGGSLAAIPLNDDGSFGGSIQSIRQGGSGPFPEQEASHVHSTVVSPDNRFLLVSDLGTDKIMVYHISPKEPNPLGPSEQGFISVRSGSGPRHLVFHPNGKFAYVIQELMGLVTAFAYKNGKLTPLQTVEMLPKDYEGAANSADAADIHIAPDGRFLYGSLRGKTNQILTYAIQEDGTLVFKSRNNSLGRTPRNFAIDPTGNFLLVGNSDDNEIVVFKRDLQSGELYPTKIKIPIGSPVCLKFLETRN